MIYKSKAPLRIGLAGGGTDVNPYSNLFGGAVLNTTISLYAHATIETLPNNKIIIEALDRNEMQQFGLFNNLPIDGTLNLLKGVYNAVQKDYPFPLKGFKLSTKVDVAAGSGLGTSSTLVVAVLGAFLEMLQIKLSKYEIAHYAYQIERNYLQLVGGKQDQYAATFGGFNFMEFKNENVNVETIPISPNYLIDLEQNLVLFYTETTRESATIIAEQIKNVNESNLKSIDAMHHLKDQAIKMKAALLLGNLNEVGLMLDYGFTHKKNMAENISNKTIEKIYAAAKNAGAIGGKISGAGGGGFMIFYCPNNSRQQVIKTLSNFAGKVTPFTFTNEGLITYTTA